MFSRLNNTLISLFIIITVLLGTSTSSSCNYYIKRFKGYKCVQEEPIGSGASAKAYSVMNGDKHFILKVSKKDKKSLMELKVFDSPCF